MVSGIVRTYLLDVQPGLVKVLAATTPGDMTRFVHGPRGLHAQEDNAGNWTWPLPDGLGSVRSAIKNALDIDSLQTYAPYGEPLESGIFGTPFTFTGEMMDANGMLYLRARYYAPGLGVFPSLDPVEGVIQQAMSLNRYGYVWGNPTNFVDPSGMISETPEIWDSCGGRFDPPPRLCPRMPSGLVFRWEESLLTIAAMSEISSAESALSTIEFQGLAYALAWVILNRVSSSCAQVDPLFSQITRIHQAAFSGSAIRNVTVFDLPHTPMALFIDQDQNPQAVRDYLNITEEAARGYTEYVLTKRFPRTAGATRWPDEARGFAEVMPPQGIGPVRLALQQWCSGQLGPGPAHNAMYYATLSGRYYQYEGGHVDERYDQLGALARLRTAGVTSCGGFGWMGTSTRLWILVAPITVSVPPREGDRSVGRSISSKTQIIYPLSSGIAYDSDSTTDVIP